MNTKRLFDAVTHQLENFPKNDMLAAKENGKWKTYSTKQVADTVNQLSAGLVSLGVKANDFTPESSDKIAIISNNRPEWVFTDLAVQQVGGILVPVYPTTNPNELAFILNDAAVKFIFVSSEDLLLKVQSIIDKVPSIQGIYTFDTIAGAKHWTEVTALATDALLEEVEAIKQSVPAEQLATIIYTSGTTGTPKGVMLSHSNIYTNVQFSKKSFPFNDAPESKVLSFLPLNHIFEKTCTYIYLYSGISIYYAESLETIGDNLKEIKPNGFTTVPQVTRKSVRKNHGKG
jgi:long-chain acyl-CoA synthetase